MKNQELTNIAKTLKPGAFARLVYYTDVPVNAEARKSDIVVTKLVRTVIRTGVRYQNIAAVQEAAATRTSEPRKVTPWWQWSDECPRVLKTKIADPEQMYLTVATAANIPKVEYYCNGRPATKQEVEGYLNPSYANREKPQMFDVKAEHIVLLQQKG